MKTSEHCPHKADCPARGQCDTCAHGVGRDRLERAAAMEAAEDMKTGCLPGKWRL